MPRMFDILRNHGKDGDPEKDRSKINADEQKNQNKDAITLPKEIPSINFPRVILESQGARGIVDDASIVSKKLISAVKTHGVDDVQKSREIYRNAVEVAGMFLEKARAKKDLNLEMDKAHALLDEIFNHLILGDSLLGNLYTQWEGEDYLAHKIAKMLILSSVIGMNMGFNKSRLNHLGLAAFFCDFGLDSLREITTLPRKLNPEEYNLIKSHISRSLEIVKRISFSDNTIYYAVLMHHERVNAKGYPHFATSEQINPYAAIIGLVDTYVAMTTNRAYRENLNAHKAVKFLLSSLKEEFDYSVMKVFINKISLYPLGTVVELKTGELAKVISVHPGLPLWPVVMIVRNASGGIVTEGNIIDLSKEGSPSIITPV